MVEIKELGEQTNHSENEPNQNEDSELQSNGEVPANQQSPPLNDHQPTRLESFFAITKSLILRALIFYFITSFFRRPAPTPAEQAGSASPAKLPAFNYFENGSTMVIEDEF